MSQATMCWSRIRVGFGTPIFIAKVFARNELEPLQAKSMEISEWLGQEVAMFKPHTIPASCSIVAVLTRWLTR
ncbi:hypothetical protein ACFWP0_13875 [Achromobacter sp. NPDC058515]|uniref:hypothetical protein n=1 Tax=Achromobacter sp. NPDC058515 TaxID=3346533 RepID=UPI0036637BBD